MKITPESRPMAREVIMKSLVVGFAYASANALATAILGSLSRLSPTLDNLSVWFLTGIFICLSLSPFIINSSWTRSRTVFAAWAVLAFVRSLGLGIEGALFKPTTVGNAIVSAIFGLLVSLLVAWLSVVLLLPTNQVSLESTNPKRSWWGWTWRVLAVGLAYFVFYFVFGATNAFLYTMSFYKNNPQYGLDLPAPGIIFLAQLLKGPLFGLGLLFVALAINLPRRKVGVWLGILLFVVGGVAPYIEVTLRTMPLGFNMATITEIFFQNFLTGIVAAYFYKKQNKK
jgi:hypothetical protein